MKRISLTGWIFLAMVAGVILGIADPGVARQLAPLSNIFLRLIRSIVAPLIFGILVAGVAAGELKHMGRIGAKALLYFEVVTTIALFLGLGAVNLARPGVGVPIQRSAAETLPAPAAGQSTLNTVLEHTFPTSIVDAMARNDVLQVVVFAFLFGAACSSVGAKARPVVEFAGALAEVMFRYTGYVMYLAPLGVGAALAVTVGSKGVTVLFGLGKLILTMYATVVVFVVVVLGAVIALARIPMGQFFRAVRQPVLIAFSTASSEAALPLAMENMEVFGVPKHIVGFVIPAGYSFNLAGTTLYLSLASVFVAQAHQQRSRRRAARRPGHPHRHPRHLPPAAGGRGHADGRRCPDGYGPYRGECARQLSRQRGGGPLGRLPVRKRGSHVRVEEEPSLCSNLPF
jgi:proton glutamate symport protein